MIGFKVPRKHPRILTAAEMQAILDGCDRLRDRLLFAVLHDTGMRIGEALGLRHEDWAAAERTVAVARVNDNGARAKSVRPRLIPISAGHAHRSADVARMSLPRRSRVPCRPSSSAVLRSSRHSVSHSLAAG